MKLLPLYSPPPDIPRAIEIESQCCLPYNRGDKKSHIPTPGLGRRTNAFAESSAKRLRPRACSLDRGTDVHDLWIGQSFKHDPAILPEENIPETDSQHIETLWNEVSVSSSRQSQPPEWATESTDPSGEGYSRDTKGPSPYDVDFANRVLEPRSTVIHHNVHSVKAYRHFEVEEPSGDRSQYYTHSRGATESSVWLTAKESFVRNVTREYCCMDRRELCEAELASYALETLLKRDRRELDLDQEKYEEVWIPKRMIELVIKPTLNLWRCPPLVGKHAKTGPTPYKNYGFDLRSDCSYWLSLQAFSPEDRTQVKSYDSADDE